MNKAGVLIGLIAGIVVGYNWQKIKRVAAPAMNAARNAASGVIIAGMRVVVEVKEDVEDALAERTAKQVKAAAPTKADAA